MFPSDSVTGECGRLVDEVIVQKDFDFTRTLLFFLKRSIIRKSSALLKPNRHPITGVIVFTLWLLLFGLQSVTWNNRDKVLSIAFQRDGYDLTLVALNAGLQLITFILVLVALLWQVGVLIISYLFILMAGVIVTVIVELTLEQKDLSLSHPIISYVVGALLALSLGAYIWTYDFVPNILNWRWQKFRTFPYGCLVRFMLYGLLVLPFWPCLAVIILNFALHFLGLPQPFFGVDSLFEINENYWSIGMLDSSISLEDEQVCTEDEEKAEGNSPCRSRYSKFKVNVRAVYFRRLAGLRSLCQLWPARRRYFSYHGSALADDKGRLIPHGRGVFKSEQ